MFRREPNLKRGVRDLGVPLNKTWDQNCLFSSVFTTTSRLTRELGQCAEVGALFTTVSSIRVSRVSRVGRVGRVSRVRVTLTVTVRVSRVSVMVSVSDSAK